MKTILRFLRRQAVVALTTQLALPLLALAGTPAHAATQSGPAAASPAPAVFRPLEFPAALEAAKREQRFVLVDFYTTWCGPCRLLDETTWQDAKVVARLSSTAVAIKVDAEREAALAKRFQIDAYPTVVVLGSDGNERDRYVGYLAPAAFLAKYEATLAGRSVVADARAKLKDKSAADPKSRLELARNLAKQPASAAEALEHFLWCYDEGVKADPRFAMQRERIPGMIASLGKQHPPALEALRVRRAALWETISAPKSRVSDRDAAQLGQLDAALRDEAAIGAAIALFPRGSSAHKAYGDPVLARLVHMQRYADALAASDIDGDFTKVSQAVATMETSGRASPAQVAEVKRKVAKDGGMPVEVLAGAGEIARARALALKLLAWDDSAAVRDDFVKRLNRAGATALAGEIAALKK